MDQPAKAQVGGVARTTKAFERAVEALEMRLRSRIEACQAILTELGSVIVAFSAGVDSTFLLCLAVHTLGRANVVAAMGVSPSLATRERRAGRQLASEIGAELIEVETDELSDPNYLANPARRCYYCKRDLFQRLRASQEQRAFRSVISGANADDTGDFRPGLDAGRELGVRNPLMEAGLTKKDIRMASRALGLTTWDKPAMACLASRIPYGQTITTDRLSRVERAEYVLKDLGFSQCRVRDHGTVARIEVPAGQIEAVARVGQRVAEHLRSLGYTYVTLDLWGFRSGSMNEVIGIQNTGSGANMGEE